MSDNSGAGQNEIHIHEILVQCTKQDADRSELNELELIIVKSQGSVPVKLTRVLGTLWKQRDQDPIPVPSKGLVLVATSRNYGDLGFGYISKDPSEFRERQEDFKCNVRIEGENIPGLLLSFSLCSPAWNNTPARSLDEQIIADPMMTLLFLQNLPDDYPIKADGLNGTGGKLQERFAITQDGADIDASINAHEQALALLSADDIRFLASLHDTGIAYKDRFQRFGKVEDINAAIERLQILLAMLPKGDEKLPAVLSNLGSCFIEQFDHTGNMDDLTQSMQLQQQAVELTPEGHADLPSQLNNLGNLFL
ncbi:hypothetical protein CVT26_007523, partial [Gymnopilus dilepis]